jgi:hypothetical protein
VHPIQEWLDNSDEYTADLYLVTGLKVAKELNFNKSNSSEHHIESKIEAKDPTAGVVDTGTAGELTDEKQQALQFNVDDIVIGYRVSLYRCRRCLFKKSRKTIDEGVVGGDLLDNRGGGEQPQTEFEALPIPEELAAREEATTIGVTECWVGLGA